jgi:O-antigen/teichoic acid export membrane protein
VLLGAGGLGRYSVVAQLAQRPVQTINPIVTRVAFPVFAELQSDSSRLRKGYLEVIAALSVVQAPAYLGLLVTAERLIPILLGKGWDDTVVTFQILCLLGFLRGLGNPIGSLLLAKGKADWGFYQNLAAVVLYGLAAAVGTRWGIEGVALALLTANLCVFFPLGFFVRRWLVGMGMREYVAAFLPALLTAVAMALAVHVVSLYLDLGNRLAELAILVVSGAVVYGGVLYLLDVPSLRIIRRALATRRQ